MSGGSAAEPRGAAPGPRLTWRCWWGLALQSPPDLPPPCGGLPSQPSALSTAPSSPLPFSYVYLVIGLARLHAPPPLTPSPIAKTMLAHPQHPFPLVLLSHCPVIPSGNPILGLTSSTAESSSQASILPPSHINSPLCQCHPIPRNSTPAALLRHFPSSSLSRQDFAYAFLEKIANTQPACLSSFPHAPLHHPVQRQTFLFQVSFANPGPFACICVLTLFMPILVPSRLLSPTSHLQYRYGLLLSIVFGKKNNKKTYNQRNK